MNHYPEISQLTAFAKATACTLSIVDKEFIANVSLIPVRFSIKQTTCTVLVEDEYNDLKTPNTLLHLELVLRELATLQEETDFLAWCKALGINASNNSLLTYYKDMVNTQLSLLQKAANPMPLRGFVTDYDFQLNAGAAQALRAVTNTNA